MLIVDGDASATEKSDGGGGLQGVPAEFRSWILKADDECKEPAMTPALLAAQLWQESKFKTSREEATSNVGAQGPAQFMPGTWATWGRDSDGNGKASPWDIGDAVMAQGRMMCSLLKQAKNSGYPGDVRALALAGYNAGWGSVQQYRGVPPKSFARGETYNYVQLILSTMARFQGPGLLQVSGSGIRRGRPAQGSHPRWAPRTRTEAADPRAPRPASATATTATSAASAPRAQHRRLRLLQPHPVRLLAQDETARAPPPHSTAPPPTGPSPAATSSPATCCSGHTAATAPSTTSRCTRATATCCTHRAPAATWKSPRSPPPCRSGTTYGATRP